MSFGLHKQNDLLWLSSSLLEKGGLCHGFSTRTGGVSPAPWDSLNFRPGQGDGKEALTENYRRFFGVCGADWQRAVLSHQVHETTVRLCTADDAGKGLFAPRDYTADALISNEP